MTEKEMAVLSKVYEEFLRLRLRLEEWMREEELIKWDKDIPGIPGATAEYRDGVLRFCIPDVPPSRHRVSLKMLHRVNREWAEKIVYAFYSLHLPVCPRFSKTLAVICIHKNELDMWDPDQILIEGIINGLKALRIFGDDNYQNLSYLVTGERCQGKSYTEIIVTKMPSIEQLIGVNLFQTI